MKNKRVGVLMGGPSSEREISIKSGKAVCMALEAKQIDYASIELMAGPNTNGYKKSVSDMIKRMKIDVAFVALHGEFGEDGTVQELLEGLQGVTLAHRAHHDEAANIHTRRQAVEEKALLGTQAQAAQTLLVGHHLGNLHRR